MLKKVFVICLCALLFLTGCQNDPYSNKRPFDYGTAIWSCETNEYELAFCVDMTQEDYYYPEGKLVINENVYFCKFYFIHQTNQLHISIYPIELATVPDEDRNSDSMLYEIIGTCEFSPESFVFNIDEKIITPWSGEDNRLIFVRTEINE